ncbi:hypothetical protein [Rossellomorea aquimaris]|uniref:Uncharacterized protein n=1 Tax=Rossellomorea aquimaris TaxID=189382 RepID=A0A366ERA9_9BACI|nr:hypothetical protein [Rossellomorea aquimaris]RBP04937.1 hypothetical protein DET59_105227 [Rossellomorea aquimaris]
MKKAKIDEITLSYLRFQNPKENRGNIIVFFLIFLDIIGVIFLLGEPMIPLIFWSGIIPVILIHLWAIPIIIAPYKLERAYYLFFGVYGVINTFVYFLVIQKLIYNTFEVETIVPAFIGLVICVSLLIVLNWINIRSLYSGTYSRLQKGEKTLNLSPIAAASGIGYVLAQFILSSFFVESVKTLIIIGVFSLLSIATAFFSTSIHKYFFIKRNMEKVKQVYPEFGLPKKLRKNT